jgi:hypothetical protein
LAASLEQLFDTPAAFSGILRTRSKAATKETISVSAILNLPTGYCMETLTFSGVGLPNGAAITLAHQLTGTGQTPTSVAGVLAGKWAALFFVSGGPWPAALTVQDLTVKFGPLATGGSATVAVGIAAGAAAGDMIVPNSAPLVQKQTALGGKRGRGRLFMPPVTEGTVGNGGILSSGFISSTQASFDAFVTQLGTSNLPPVLLHRYDPALGQSPMTPTAITAMVLQSRVATQRNRLRR